MYKVLRILLGSQCLTIENVALLNFILMNGDLRVLNITSIIYMFNIM